MTLLLVTTLIPMALGAAFGWRRGILAVLGLWATILAITVIDDPGAWDSDFFWTVTIAGCMYFPTVAAVGAAFRNVVDAVIRRTG